MSIFKRATNTQAYLKAGIMGFAGDGKTFTAAEIAIGMVELMRSRKLPAGDLPVMFLDTETGSDWVKPRFDAAHIELMTAKTRVFVDLLSAIRETQESGSILIVDSISHFWRNIMEEYAERKNRKRGLEFQDWAWLKQEWGHFTDLFVNSNCHIIMCGRAGYEYDFFENANGKKELEKTGIKMKAEGETGYEPSILVLMEKHRDIDTGKVWRTANVVKDRSTLIDGKTFTNPTFKDFLPHIEFLNLGGQHVGVESGKDNAELFAEDGEPKWEKERKYKDIAFDEIGEIIGKHYPGSTAEAKKQKGDLLEAIFATRSWERIKTFNWPQIRDCRNALWLKLEGKPYEWVKPPSAEPPAPIPGEFKPGDFDDVP